MQTLSDWYLARLRRLSVQDDGRKHITPHTLVESDKLHIQQLVSQFADSHESRTARFYDLLKVAQSSEQQQAERILVAASISGLLILLAILLSG